MDIKQRVTSTVGPVIEEILEEWQRLPSAGRWVLGLAVGVALIWVAADFERRRSQWLQITQTWLDNLDGWQ